MFHVDAKINFKSHDIIALNIHIQVFIVTIRKAYYRNEMHIHYFMQRMEDINS